ncbi:MAG: hypothetical protein DHS20C19_26790 [Acidimicrobiales bacterium]|nr:MAG: hypothetical protein DHS20C19_26790 [Acidimicrobiales bacterium]
MTLSGPTLAELESFGADPFLELCRALEPEHVLLNRAEHHALELRSRDGIEGAGTTVVTNGRRPTLVIDRTGASSVEVPPIDDVLDRTGVGDGFIAGFLRSRRSGADPASAAHAGHRVSASVLRNFGPTSVAP